MNNRITKIAVGIMVLILAGAAVFTLGFKRNPEGSPEPTASQSPVPSQSAEQIDQVTPAASPKTMRYSNEKFGFSFEFPSYFSFKRASETDINTDQSLSSSRDARLSDVLIVDVMEKSLDGIKLRPGDGSIRAVFAFDHGRNAWTHVPDNYASETDEAVKALQPQRYTTKTGVVAWLAKNQRDYMSTQGGHEWEEAYIESPSKTFIVKILAMRCNSMMDCEKPLETPKNEKNADYMSSPSTINAIVDTLKFNK